VRETRRTRKVGDVVRSELARLLREELRDPDIGFATVTTVEMAPDSARPASTSPSWGTTPFDCSLTALNRAASHLRGLVGRNDLVLSSCTSSPTTARSAAPGSSSCENSRALAGRRDEEP
jgi:ribosome-binding factor A